MGQNSESEQGRGERYGEFRWNSKGAGQRLTPRRCHQCANAGFRFCLPARDCIVSLGIYARLFAGATLSQRKLIWARHLSLFAVIFVNLWTPY